MSTKEIPKAAIEAATQAMFIGRPRTEDHWASHQWKAMAQAALVAAAPFMQDEKVRKRFVETFNDGFADGIKAAAQLYEKAHGITPSAFAAAIRALKPETK